MIKYFRCSEVDIDKAYQAFKIGFSDYLIKMDIDKESFISHFFGAEGNQLEHSFLALDGDKPVGLVLGGIKEYEGLKTIRCGALCMHPDYRGKGISQELFKLHKEEAIKEGCKQLFLEVLVGNDRAIKFYKNLGYERVYDLSYFSCNDTSSFREESLIYEVKKIDYDELSKLKDKVVDLHINWQNDFDYMEKLNGLNYYGVYNSGQLIAGMCISPSGKVYFIHIVSKYRGNGIGKGLIARAVKDMNLSKLSISFPNNASLEGFIKLLGFKRDKIAQYEMYLTLFPSNHI